MSHLLNVSILPMLKLSLLKKPRRHISLSSAEYALCGINYCTKLDDLTVIYNPIPTPFNLLMHQGHKLPEQRRQALKYRKIISIKPLRNWKYQKQNFKQIFYLCP